MTIINYLTTIRFEHRALRHIAREASEVGISRPLVVTDPGGFSGLGYAGSRSGAITFSLSLEGIRVSTRRETL